jgi:Listeria/Bacterioides repeat
MKNKKMLISVFAVLVIAFAGITFVSLMSEDESDAAASEFTVTIEAGKAYSNYSLYAYSKSGSGMLGGWGPESQFPPGLSIHSSIIGGKANLVVDGTTSWVGSSQLYFYEDIFYQHYFTLNVVPSSFTVTYNSGMGLINGASTWSETIPSGHYATLPSATYSSGAYTFKGWATTSTSSTPVANYIVTGNATLYAVWEQNSTSISSYSATVTNGQHLSNTFTTNPSNASLSITSNGGLSGLSISGRTLSGTVSANPGTYSMTISCAASGYKTTTTTVKITVPIEIVEPIQYTLPVGFDFAYEPVTNPKNAAITITGVTMGGASYPGHGFTVDGRTIKGTLTQTGTVGVTFSASGSGYVSVNKTVLISVYDPPVISDPATISDINIVQRANEPRTFDFIAIGVSNAVNIEWYVDGVLFASSHNTAVFEVPTAGKFTVKAKVYGANNSTDEKSKDFVCAESYYPELAWVGIKYAHVLDPGITVSENADWLFVETVTVNGQTQYVVSGIPDSSHVGNSYTLDLSAGDDIVVTVYAAETEAPVSSFDVVVNGQDVSVTFTGSGASVVYYDYNDGSKLTKSTTHTYSGSGYFSIRAIAVNNVSERISIQIVEIGIVEVTTISLTDLTDMYVIVNETIVLQIEKETSDVLSISGTASQWLEVFEDNKVIGAIDRAGDFTLTLILTHSDATTSEGSITIYVRNGGNDDDDDDDDDDSSFFELIILIAIVFGAIGAYALFGRKGGKKK